MYSEVIKSLGQNPDAAGASTHAADPLARAKGAAGSKQRRDSSQFLRPNVDDPTEVDESHLPFLHLKRKTGTNWNYSKKLTNICEWGFVLGCSFVWGGWV